VKREGMTPSIVITFISSSSLFLPSSVLLTPVFVFVFFMFISLYTTHIHVTEKLNCTGQDLSSEAVGASVDQEITRRSGKPKIRAQEPVDPVSCQLRSVHALCILDPF
jgi:hypothetical protein